MFLGRDVKYEWYAPPFSNSGSWSDSGVKTIAIGDSVTYIDGSLLTSCKYLETINCLPQISPSHDAEFSNSQYMELKVYVPKGALSAYQSAEPWKNFWNLQEMETNGIEDVEVYKGENTNIFDLQGRKWSVPKRGLNIIDSKKVIMK